MSGEGDMSGDLMAECPHAATKTGEPVSTLFRSVVFGGVLHFLRRYMETYTIFSSMELYRFRREKENRKLDFIMTICLKLPNSIETTSSIKRPHKKVNERLKYLSITNVFCDLRCEAQVIAFGLNIRKATVDLTAVNSWYH